MQRLNKIIISILALLFTSLLIVSCQNEKVNLKTIVNNKVQIDINYNKGTYINQPSYILPNNTKFLGWYINDVKIEFPYKLQTNTIFTAKFNNQSSNQNGSNLGNNSNISFEPITDFENFTLNKESLNNDFNGYYKSITATNKKDLFLQLNKLLNTYPVYKNTTYNQVWDIIIKADIRPEVSEEYISGIYGYYFRAQRNGGLIGSLSPDSNESTFNREHVWPQSALGISKSEKAQSNNRNIATDAHNLRASGVNINALRGSMDFVPGTGRAKTMGNYTFYPGDISKGDVARILLYMAVRYKDQLSLKKNPHNPGYGAGYGELGQLQHLNNWNSEDTPDALERKRNDVIFSYQKNRNPFIDHPEWVAPIWSYLMDLDK